MIDTPEKRAIISGIGISHIGRRTGVPALDLTLESSREAIADAGLTPADIDGVSTLGETPISEAAGALGITPVYRGGGFDTGGLLSPVMSAFLAVAEGRARHVLVYRTVQMMGGAYIPREGETQARDDGDGAGDGEGEAAAGVARAMADMQPLLAAHAFSAVNWLGMHCQRHMHLYGTTREQLGSLAVNSRRNAGLNPLAVYRDPTDVDIAELYEGFTFLTFAWLEALGLCGDGESGPFVEGGRRIALDGALPLNTYGGQLSAGRMHGYWVLHEACVQLRGDAGERQVRRQPEVAVISNGGGPIAGCMLLTR